MQQTDAPLARPSGQTPPFHTYTANDKKFQAPEPRKKRNPKTSCQAQRLNANNVTTLTLVAATM
eukprot:358374-Chlamydomonas_euryale.AAC.4